ncbi:MAG: AAA family ATPase [Ardenticatenaceae bacterium]|nr:AAA family ATPase [Ardenticatenaceae bacterium]MCB8987676.1 AAA family ATPase [Ardenticatenaceae bacterium]
MVDYQLLEDAIVTIRTHRTLLGDAVVETAVAALQEKLRGRTAVAEGEAFDAAFVLQADLSGFTAMSADMDAEQVRDMVNALWERLDNVVRAWGGLIEKHTGDGLIALFGMPTARDDDAERAVLAALDMQMELTLFNEAARRRTDTGPLERRKANGELHMRLAIHAGPVVRARVGANRELTAVGEAITLVEYLEQAAPVGGVLISYDVYRHIYGQFEVSPSKSLEVPGRQEPLEVYAVQREKPRAFHPEGWSRQSFRTRFVDRTAELERLQFALQETINNSVMQVVAVVGEAGSGKSRLFDEFEQLLELQPVQGCILRSRADPTTAVAPYALMRDFFGQLFEIHLRSSTAVGREKFVRGVENIMQAHQISAREQAHVMGHYLGFDFSDSPYLQELMANPDRLRRYAQNDLARFFTDLANGCPPVVWLVENAQWADAASLDLIEFLLERCSDLPLLVVCLARPELLAQRPSWQSSDPFHPITTLVLPPLTAIDTRHLVTQNLEEVPNLPLKLTDLVVYGAQGNPLYVEQMIHLLFDQNIIARHGENWQMNLSKLDELAVPETLAGLFQARVECLPEPEQTVLQLAALFGPQFWDGAVRQVAVASKDLEADQVAAALEALEQKDLIVRRHSSALAGVLEYQFVHDILRDVVYRQMPPARRRENQIELLAWLTNKVSSFHLPFFQELLGYLRSMMATDQSNRELTHD